MAEGAGKGFVLVAGGVNIDIGGQAADPLVFKDSNPGTVTVSLGGVGRNIAHDLRLLGVETSLLTALGEDAYAQEVERSCRALGIGMDAALRVPGGRTSTYLFLSGPDGDMALAVSDMEIYDTLTPAYFQKQLPLLRQAAVTAADTNLPEDALRYLAEHSTAPLFVDPVSVPKAAKLRGILGRVHTIKPNRLEAELLSGVAIRDQESLEQAAKVLLETGLQRAFITLGGEGIYAAQGDQRCFLPAYPARTRSATGGGDAFAAGLIWAWLQGMDLKESARAASAAASIAVEGAETINPDLSARMVRERMQKLEEEA